MVSSGSSVPVWRALRREGRGQRSVQEGAPPGPQAPATTLLSSGLLCNITRFETLLQGKGE